MKVAFFGLGIMGRGMAANLVKAGHDVTVWNRTPGKVTMSGAKEAKSPADAARDAEALWMCVSDTAAVENILFSAKGAASALRPGMYVADSSTISPAATRDFAQRVAAKDAHYVDAPVTGSKVAAEGGTLTFMAGGAAEDIAHLQPLFDAMGKRVVHMGGVGMGQSAKLAMNLQIALIYQGFAEGLTLASKLGVAPEKLIELIQASMVRSGVIDYKAPFVMQRDWSPNFPLRLMFKDLNLASEAARQLGLDLPGLDTVRNVYETSMKNGSADLDYSATLEVLDQQVTSAPK
jgi:3-hydroxyisobutyrate dehydrogenase-like beta-hydroxyacid dehydrogenase